MTREQWIDAFTRRGLELDDRLSGTDWDDIAADVLGERDPGCLDPRAAADQYAAASVNAPASPVPRAAPDNLLL